MTDSRSELLPCPFCGSSSVSEVHGDPVKLRWLSVACGGCGASSMESAHIDRAIAAWNRRSPAAAAETDVEGLMKLADAMSRADTKAVLTAETAEYWANARDRENSREALRTALISARVDARKEARKHFLHEHGKELNDAKKWQEWHEAQLMVEEDMPEGYCVILECSPGDWSLRFTDPEGEDIRIDDYESTAGFIRDAVAIAKERETALAPPASLPVKETK